MNVLATRFIVSPDIRSDTDCDGTAILQIDQDRIYSIVGVGSLIWSKLVAAREGLAQQDVIEALSSDFKNIPRPQIERDVERFFKSFHNKGFIEASQCQSGRRRPALDFVAYVFLFLARNITGMLLKLRLRGLAAFCGLAAIDFLLKLVSFGAFYNFVKYWPVNRNPVGLHAINEINEAVTKASTWYPKQAMCLQRSAVTTVLLRSRGISGELVVGCRKFPFLVHAWVEVDHEVINDTRKVQETHKVLDRC